MKSKNSAPFMIANSILWAVAILASAYVLRGTEHAQDIFYILFVLWFMSFLMLQNDERSVKVEWECIRRFFRR